MEKLTAEEYELALSVACKHALELENENAILRKQLKRIQAIMRSFNEAIQYDTCITPIISRGKPSQCVAEFDKNGMMVDIYSSQHIASKKGRDCLSNIQYRTKTDSKKWKKYDL